MPNPNDVIQAIDAVTGDLQWEYRRDIPDDVNDYLGGLISVNRNIAIWDDMIIDTANDDYVFALERRSPESWSGRRSSSTTRRTPPGTRPARSSPTAR